MSLLNIDLISIIVPCYNTDEYIAECIDSICVQSYKNLEIIVIDDGSTDNSLITIEEKAAKDNRISFYKQKNQGSSVARNKGIDLAKGKYIMFVDSDDFISKYHIEELYNSAKENDVYVSINNTYIIYYNSNKFKKVSKSICDAFIKNQIDHNPWNKIYSLSFLRKTKVKFLEGIKHQDYLFWNQLIAHLDNVSFVNGSDYFYRQRLGSIMQLCNQEYEDDIIICINEFYKYYNKHKGMLNFKPFHISLVDYHLYKTPFKYRLKFIITLRKVFLKFDSDFLILMNRESHKTYKRYKYVILPLLKSILN